MFSIWKYILSLTFKFKVRCLKQSERFFRSKIKLKHCHFSAIRIFFELFYSNFKGTSSFISGLNQFKTNTRWIWQINWNFTFRTCVCSLCNCLFYVFNGSMVKSVIQSLNYSILLSCQLSYWWSTTIDFFLVQCRAKISELSTEIAKMQKEVDQFSQENSAYVTYEKR